MATRERQYAPLKARFSGDMYADDLDALKAEAARRGVKYSALIREVVHEFVQGLRNE